MSGSCSAWAILRDKGKEPQAPEHLRISTHPKDERQQPACPLAAVAHFGGFGQVAHGRVEPCSLPLFLLGQLVQQRSSLV